MHFAMGNSKKAESTKKKVAQANREAYLQHTGRSVLEASAIVCRATSVVRRGIGGVEDSHDWVGWL